MLILDHLPSMRRQTLDGFARHYETGEKLPEDLYQRLLAARTYRWVCVLAHWSRFLCNSVLVWDPPPHAACLRAGRAA